CAKAKRQQKGFILCESVVQRSDSNSTDVGHEGVITGCDAFSLRSSIADPRGVAQSPLQSTYSQGVSFNKCHPNFSDETIKCKVKRVSLKDSFCLTLNSFIL
ncbi:hypothetical protein, partial [Lysinibacillus sp. NPDC059133]|uniref:hypothetical protein n=1 Tax=Lysinibacillus sp. NPDC059133 TaxID=3346737 RepID=UPI0036AE744C